MKYWIFACIWVAGMLLLGSCNPKHDDSDPPGGHSGMDIFHDELTGCEYVGRAWGGLTPRMNADGKQVCRARVVQ